MEVPQIEEIVKITVMIGEYLIESIDKNGELPLLILGMVLMYAIGVYIKITGDEGYGPK